MEIETKKILNYNYKIKSKNSKCSDIIYKINILNYFNSIFLFFAIIFCIFIFLFYNIFKIKKKIFINIRNYIKIKKYNKSKCN